MMTLQQSGNKQLAENQAGVGGFQPKLAERTRFAQSANTWPNRWQWVPAADLRETDAAYFLEVDAPGIEEDALRVYVEGERVTVCGDRTCKGANNQRGFHRFERALGPFQRTFDIPGHFDEQHVNAEYRHGVLRVVLPKARKLEPHRIPVSGG